MKIGFYSPYLNILGGGERYLLQMASFLSQTHIVDVYGDPALKEKAEKYLGLNLKNVNFLPDIFRSSSPTVISKILKTKEYDRFFYVTDGSLFISIAKKNFLIVQVPQQSMYSSDLFTKLKLSFWQTQLVYSDYVKQYIDKWWGINSTVFPPSINTTEFNIGPKSNLILSVGRFFPLPHSKKQEVLVEVFKSMCKKGLKDWKLVLAGGVDEDAKSYFAKIKSKAKGLPIEFYPNAPRAKLLDLYAKAKIYWHAAGFGEDLSLYPERAEHFGITTLEAMASGCVPLVYPAGGQKEIVRDDINGLYWMTKNELIEKTLSVINNSQNWQKLSLGAKEKAQEYDNKNFEVRLDKLIS